MSEDSSTVATSTTTSTDESTKIIYIGPNLPKHGLPAWKIYSDGIPSHFDDLITACPEIEKLFVKMSKFIKAKQQIQKTGSAYNIWYQKVLKYKATGK